MLDDRLNAPWWSLRLAYGAVPIIAGLDKFTNLLTDWGQYLSPVVERIIPFSGATFMHLVGIIEIGAGVLVLTKRTRLGAYVVAAWLLGIVVNLLMTGRFFDIAVRDAVMALGAFTLAKLAEVREARRAQAQRSTQGLEPTRAGA